MLLVSCYSEEPIAGDEMSTIPAKESDRNRGEPHGRNLVCVPPANHTCDGKEVCCFASGGGT
jgi:hypothetical protein